MLFDNALWKAALTGIASNTNAAIMVPQVEARFIWKRPLDANQLGELRDHDPVADAADDGLPWGDPFIKAHLNAVHSEADGDELTKLTLIGV